MKANTSYPSGYKVATKADRTRLGKREVNAGVNLNEGEVLKIEQLICRETSHKDADGNTIISYRLDCSSSVKPRLVPLNIFNPYPKDRNEFMKRSDFFKKVLDFSGSYDDFVDFLLNLDKNLVVKKVERLAYIPYGSNEERFQNFYLLDFEE